MKVKKVVIPVAGAGTRLLPVTKCQPKEMLPVGRKPVVQYVVEEAEAAGLEQILLVTGRQKTSIEDHFDRDVALERELSASGKSDLLEELAFQQTKVRFFYTRQNVQLGLGDAIAASRKFTGDEDFVVSLGDSIIENSAPPGLLARMIEVHVAQSAQCTVAVEEVDPDEAHRYGIVMPADDAGEVFQAVDLVEKPRAGEAPSNLAIAARYVFSPHIFDAIDRTPPDTAGEVQITDSIRVLLSQGMKVVCVKLGTGARRYDIGNFESYFRAFVDFALKDPKYGYMLRQHILRTVR